MGSVLDVRAGLQTALGTIDGLRVAAGFDLVTVPAAMVGEVEVDYDRTFGRGLDEMLFKIRVYASRASDRGGMERIDGYLEGAASVKSALEADVTLGGACSTLRVERVEGYGVYEVANTAYVGAEFIVRVWAAGS